MYSLLQLVELVGLVFCLLALSLVVKGQEIHFGDSPEPAGCSTPDGRRGSCKLHSECPGIIDVTRAKICGIDSGVEVVCCPEVDTTDTNVRNVRRNVRAPKIDFECGKQESQLSSFDGAIFRRKRAAQNFQGSLAPAKLPTGTGPQTDQDSHLIVEDFDHQVSVVGGEISLRNSWPWMALFGRKVGGENSFFCDGVLINHLWILTAAHCLLDFDDFFVRLGEHDYNAPSFNVQDHQIRRTLVHPDYNGNDGYNDIGLVRLRKKVDFTKTVSPICLPWGKEANKRLVDEVVTLTGWGTTRFGGISSSVLREASVTIFHPSVCERSYSTLRGYDVEFPEGMTTENIICAGDEDGGVDACQGDSGGPLQRRSTKRSGNNPFTVIAIVSKGHGCGLQKFPGLYTPVAPALAWIKRIAF